MFTLLASVICEMKTRYACSDKLGQVSLFPVTIGEIGMLEELLTAALLIFSITAFNSNCSFRLSEIGDNYLQHFWYSPVTVKFLDCQDLPSQFAALAAAFLHASILG